MRKRAKDLALSAMSAALGTALLFTAGALPTARLFIAGLAGLLGAVVRMKCGFSWAMAAYAVTALLSLLLVPQKAVSILFTLFLGYYPIIKGSLERLSSKMLRWALKFGVFNASLALCLALAYTLLTDGLPSGPYLLPVLLLGANAAFLAYDLALTQLILFYLRRLDRKIK